MNTKKYAVQRFGMKMLKHQMAVPSRRIRRGCAPLVILLLCLSVAPVSAQSTLAKRYPIIPYPSQLVPEKGNFSINKDTKVVVQYAPYRQEAAKLADLVRQVGGFTLQYGGHAADNCIIIKDDAAIQSKEGYHLMISPGKIILAASAPAGIFYGIETIRQLLPVALPKNGTPGALSLPAVKISDHPAFAWRGMMLDVARHFYSVDYLKKFINRMALYKLNRLHLHLTDDQGWRIQIKKYPQLTKQGAWRTFDNIDSECIKLSKVNPAFKIDTQHIIHRDGKTLYGGYYTQAQMRNIIKYASARNIQIIPEIDMPGHEMSAIRIFPYLSCTGKAGHGKIFSVPLCPCKPSTFTFAKNVYKEIFELFPSKYVHIGGDEVDKTTWKNCAACKVTMQKEGLKNVDQLQSYFIKKMEKFFHAHGKTMIGWDDILEGGMDSSAVIMYWRIWAHNAPVEAAKDGNNVIMTPDGPLYFDAWPNKNTLSTVYHYNPVPAALQGTPLAHKILGAQANLWAERIPSEERADYLTMPRMTALAEMVWSYRPGDYHLYLQRLQYKYPRWNKMHIHYRIPDLKGFTDNNIFIDSAVLKVQKPLPDLIIHYTTDGTIPNSSSAILPPSLPIKKTTNIKLIAFTPEGDWGDVYTLKYEKESYMAPVHINHAVKGLSCIYYKGSFKDTKQVTTVSPAHTYIVHNIRVPADIKAPAFGLQYRGYISVPETGIYSFYLTSDDGSLLRIGDKVVVNNDGLHSAQERSGQIALQKGLHPFSLDFIEGGGGYTLHLQYSRQGGTPEDIPDNVFSHK